jgi:hypothetical protein
MPDARESTRESTRESPAAESAMRQRAAEIGAFLQQTIELLLADLGRRGSTDQRSLQQAFDLSQSATSRLVSAVRQGDPLATLSLIPGPEALQQMLRGAAAAGAAPERLRAAEEAVARLRSFLDVEVGNRGTLDALLVDWVHEARGSFELRQKAAAFKAMSAIRGVQAETVMTTAIIHPSAEPGLCDSVGIDALLGCRRLRPSGVLRLTGVQMAAPEQVAPFTALDGRPLRTLQDLLLAEFSTLSAERIETARHGNQLELTVRELPLGRGTERGDDLVCSQLFRGSPRLKRGDGPPHAGAFGQAEPPCEHYVLDVLLHDEVWPGVVPELYIFDTVVRGLAHADDPSRNGDRLDLLEAVQAMGRGADSFRLPQFPRYVELVRHVCAQRDWDPARLRGFRCKVRYPIYGSQTALTFALSD